MTVRKPMGHASTTCAASAIAWALMLHVATAQVDEPAQLALLDGSVRDGHVNAISNASVTVTNEDQQEKQIPFAQLLEIRWAKPSEPLQQANLRLIDGTMLPISKYTATKGRATVSAANLAEPIEIATRQIAVVHLHPPTAAIATQWRQLLQSKPAGDVIVIRKEDAIDHVEGRIGDATAKQVLFYLDEEEIAVNADRVDGFIYYHPRTREFPEPIATVHAAHGMRIYARSIEWSTQRVQIISSCGLRISLPTNAITAMDFSAGKIRFLSDVKPDQLAVTPQLSFGESARLAQSIFEPVLDRGFFSPTAQLRHAVLREQRIVGWEIKEYRRSVGLRSRTEISYRVPSGFDRFRALAGIDGTVSGSGNVQLTITADGTIVYDETVSGSLQPQAIDVPLAGARRVTVLVDYGENGDAGDRLYLCDARFTK